jgi:hypothetical protein
MRHCSRPCTLDWTQHGAGTNKLENVIDRSHEVAFPPSRLLTWTAPRSVILLTLTSRRGGTDEFLGAGFSDPATLGLWPTTRGQTLHTCLVQLRADTVRWKFSGAAERDRVNSIRGVTLMKKTNLQNSGVRLLTSEAIYGLSDRAPHPGFYCVCARLNRCVRSFVSRSVPLKKIRTRTI